MRKSRIWLVVAFAASLSACVPQAGRLKQDRTFDTAAAQRIKTLAIMPFINANALSAEDLTYKGKYHEALATGNVYTALQEQGRFKIIPVEKVRAALEKQGFPPGLKGDVSIMKAIFDPNKYRISMTMHQAMKAGKATGADGLLFGSFGMVGFAQKVKFAMAMRLVDAKTGKVVWGAARSEKMKISLFHPIKSQGKQLQAMAKSLIQEAP